MPVPGSSTFAFVEDCDAVCGGLIGAGTKFCVKPRGSCSIVSHQKKRFDEMKPGVYLRGPKEDAHCRPFVSAEKLYPEALQHVLISKFETITDARRHIEALKGAEGVIESVSDLAQLGTKKPKIEAFTPVRKRLKTEDLRTKLDQVLLTVATEMGLGAGDDEPVKDSNPCRSI